MKKLRGLIFDRCRKPHPIFREIGDDGNGFFTILRGGIIYKVIASSEGWDHVSVSLAKRNGTIIKRCPTWEEMCWIKDLFFKPDEWAMQYHPPADDNINNHPYCLHLWRPHKEGIPKPPKIMV